MDPLKSKLKNYLFRYQPSTSQWMAGETNVSASTSVTGSPPADVVPSPADVVPSPADVVPSPADAVPSPTDVPSPVDPALWPEHITDTDRLEIVRRGPFKVPEGFSFPKGPDGRAFHINLQLKSLPNKEKIQRSWLVYSAKNNAVFCFACKLFGSKIIKLTETGYGDWSNINICLRSHEGSPDHVKCMLKWKELDMRLKKNATIDQQALALMEAEKKRWQDVLKRLFSITLSLATRNLPFRGSSQSLYQQDNGNFLKEVELLAEFDSVIQRHVAKVTDEASRTHYLGQQTQNEIIQIISSQIVQAIVAKIKEAKYYAIILDCTPDISHKEQMSLVVRIVELVPKPDIKEYFLGYMDVVETTGLNLSNVVLDKLRELDISFKDCRGQAYDNGANMKGKRQGVQARLLKQNSRAVFVPCAAHTMNLVISDAARSSTDAIGYFGYLQRLFCFFSAATQRWDILLKHVKLTLKSWTDVRWESRLQSVMAVRSQVKEVREALLEARQTVTEPVARSEAQSLAEEVGSFRFIICTIVWAEVLSVTNQVNKLLQSSSVQLDIAASLIETAKASLTKYRQSGFSEAIATATELCETLNIEPELKKKRLRSTKKQFGYEAPDEPLNDAQKRLEVDFFNRVVDCALLSLQERFETLSQVRDTFGLLLDFQKVHGMSKEDLHKRCIDMEKTLTDEGEADVDGLEMMQEIINLAQLPLQTTAMEMLTFLHDNNLQEVYPNLWVALRISLTLPVTVASAERSFSKLKLIKTYLRSTMGQERLSGLAVISINAEVAHSLSYDDLISDFASRKCRRALL
uniref:TTF-type domain-containing protein n=1 Tax=Myripristis murdjan TaxID=586833 RepID=A0A667XPW6_9TELE